jgi:hypothetical protein
MNAFLAQAAATLRLYSRSRMALIYSYLFPVLFLVAFWVLYRYDRVPLLRHMGELLTVSVLGGTCFGLPTSLVAERERGIWRRYRLAPVGAARLVGGTLAARYVIALSAGLLQLGLAMAIGMTAPEHPLDLFVAYTAVTFAFLGLGLVIAAMADTVPAVQALGQCLFLPMLIIGGVAVPLVSLPDWAQHLSAFFPGRYAVEALQEAVNGGGLVESQFSLMALLIIGLSALVAGAALFRWDAQQKFALRSGKSWIAVALAGWVVVGVLAEWSDRIFVPAEAAEPAAVESLAVTTPTPAAPAAVTPVATPPPPTSPVMAVVGSTEPAVVPSLNPTPGLEPDPVPATTALPGTWQALTLARIEEEIYFTNLPPDEGVVAPISPPDETPPPDVQPWLTEIERRLPDWEPAQESDRVQRLRNILYVAAVPDSLQIAPLENYIPRVVFSYIETLAPKDELIRMLAWIALNPGDGDLVAVSTLGEVVGFPVNDPDPDGVRERTALYAVKLLGRLMGRIPE